MIIIGILAAIAIPVFLSQKSKAKDTSAKADVTVIGKDIAAFYVDGTAGLTAAGDASTAPANFTLTPPSPATAVDSGKLSTGNKVTATFITGADKWCVTVQNASTGTKPWSYMASSGLLPGTCTNDSTVA